MKNLKLMLTIIAIALFSIPLVCSTIVYVRPGKIIVHADYYPVGTTTADYNLVVRNDNDKLYNITVTVSTSLTNYITLSEEGFTLEADEEKTVVMTVDLGFSSYKSGDVSVLFTPFDGVGLAVPYAVSVEMYPRGTNPQQPCDQPFCGLKPNCIICSDLNGCYNGYYRRYDICSNNQCVMTIESCTETCCDKYYNSTYAYCGEDSKCHSYTPHPPVIGTYSPSSLTPTVTINKSLKFTQVSSDEDGDTLTYTWFLDKTQKATTQNWTYSPGQGDIGTHNVTFVVSDGKLIDSVEWTVTVLEKELKPNGESCGSDSECQSGYCVHSVCRSSDPYCGDGHCDSGETCSSCSSDCGSCSSDDNSGDSGGSSGGGGGGGGGGTTTVKTTSTVQTTTVETTTVPETTVETTIVEEETVGKNQVPTGAFTLPQVLMNNWYFIPIPIALAVAVVLIWKFYPEIFMTKPSNKGYAFVEIKPTESSVTYEEPKKQEVVKTERGESNLVKVENERKEQVRNKQIEEMRRRALEEDKKFK